MGLNIVKYIKKLTLNSNFFKKIKGIFIKKKPKDYVYPYSLINPVDIFNEKSSLDHLYFIGENWFKKKDAPIAILWGFNDWKLGFSSDYLPEYRTVFVPRKKNFLLAQICIQSLINKSSGADFVNIVWGYNDSKLVRLSMKLKGQPLYRMEDGFLRSAELGASHATPYSLVLDKNELYFNCYAESDLEKLLSNYKFEHDDIISAKEKISLIIDNNISKYNMPSLDSFCPLGANVKHRRRVVIVGQVDTDASIKYGNPDKWTSEKLVRLAHEENIGSEILYRPHPDVFNGYQTSAVRRKKIEQFARIISPNEPLAGILSDIDHVYTISSLSGFEALLRGVKVTVVGCPFYSGWGITDDRCQSHRARTRKLTVEEIFFCAYVIYPRYLGCLDNNDVGFVSSLERIKAEKNILELKNKRNNKENQWAKVAFNGGKVSGNIVKLIPYKELLSKESDSCLYQVIIMLILVNIAESLEDKERVLSHCFEYSRADAYNQVLCLLNESVSTIGIETLPHLANLLFVNKEAATARDIISNNFYSSDNGMLGKSFSNESSDMKISKEKFVRVLDVCLSNRDIDLFQNLLQRYLVECDFSLSVIKNIMWLFENRFDFNGLNKIVRLIRDFDLNLFNRNSILWEMKCRQFTGSPIREIASDVCILKPDKVQNLLIALEGQGSLSSKDVEVFKSIIRMGKNYSVSFVNALLALEDFQGAREIAKELVRFSDDNDSNYKSVIAYSQALSFCGEIEQAKSVMFTFSKYKDNTEITQECLRLCIIDNDYQQAKKIIERAQLNKIEVGEMYLRKTYFGLREIGKAFETFTDFNLAKVVRKYYSDKYVDTLEPWLGKSVILISIFGPGDEIRFSSIYDFIQERFSGDLYISCSPKIHPLIKRSFPKIKFISCDRPRNTDVIELINYEKVRSFELSSIINNDVSDVINSVEKVALVTDFLHLALPSYEDFERKPYLIHNESKTLKFKKRLRNVTETLVGISWRSSITTHSRNEHYLTIEQLSCLFELDNVKFVNFQYDDCEEELKWINLHFPGKLINFSDVDHYNDFDTVASLMKCMDLIISPATTVSELAGALGCDTWLFSNSSELDWRKINDCNDDVWHCNTKIIEGDTLGDKNSLLKKLTNELISFISENESKKYIEQNRHKIELISS